MDGWLIKSENYQALNTILPKFKEKVQTIYIDPPFNTGNKFFYNDNFQNSIWLTMLENKLSFIVQYLKDDGSLYIHLDKNSNYYGRILLDNIIGKDNFKAEISWDTCGITGFKTNAKNWIRNSDSILYYSKNIKNNKYIKLCSLINVKDSQKVKEERKEKNLGWLDLLQ